MPAIRMDGLSADATSCSKSPYLDFVGDAPVDACAFSPLTISPASGHLPCQIHLGHTFNWEWGQLILKKSTPYKLMVVYMPISNKIFEKIFYDSRTRSGSIFLPATSMRSAMVAHNETQYLLGLVADQNPGALSTAYWVNFFGKPTAFVSGPEKAARLKNIPVFFAHIEKPKRGYYNAVLKIGELNPSDLKEGELTLRYVKYLQEVIQQNPDMWLWSHRRWKHELKEEHMRNWVDSDKPNNQRF